MTPDDQMRAIAKTQGMPEIHNVVGRGWVYGFKDGDNLREIKVPRYLEDLNAAHEFENTLTSGQRRYYAECLIQVHPLRYDPTIRVKDENLNDNYMKLFLIANMSAAQRAEAFIKAKGLWVDERKPESKISIATKPVDAQAGISLVIKEPPFPMNQNVN